MTIRVVVVDDFPLVREGVARALDTDPGIEVIAQAANEIGKELFISPRTVQNHLTRIREKTGLRRRSELTRWAVQHAIG